MKTTAASPQLKARAAGIFYLLAVLTAAFAESLVRARPLYAVGLMSVVCFAIVHTNVIIGFALEGLLMLWLLVLGVNGERWKAQAYTRAAAADGS